MTHVAILGSGNTGTDLMFKILGRSQVLQLAAVAGIDPNSDGLGRARRQGIATTAEGLFGLNRMPEFQDIELVFDATSAAAYGQHAVALRPTGRRVVDLTLAAIGPYVLPVVNMTEHLDARNLNMVTCGVRRRSRSWPRSTASRGAAA